MEAFIHKYIDGETALEEGPSRPFNLPLRSLLSRGLCHVQARERERERK